MKEVFGIFNIKEADALDNSTKVPESCDDCQTLSLNKPISENHTIGEALLTSSTLSETQAMNLMKLSIDVTEDKKDDDAESLISLKIGHKLILLMKTKSEETYEGSISITSFVPVRCEYVRTQLFRTNELIL